MRIFRGFEEAKGIRNPVVTTGSFDGVHIGHKTILIRLKALAGKYDGESVLITFDPHPRKVLYPESAGKDLKLITSAGEKLNLLEEAGLDNLIFVKFTKEFSRVTSEEFVRDYLRGILNAKVIVVGFNHHFGFNKEGDYKHLWTWREKYNFEAEEIPEQEVQHEAVSSTKIRKAISEGYIQRANAYLDHYYIIMGYPEEYIDDRELLSSFLKIPLIDECKLIPATGVYAVSVKTGTHVSRGMAVIIMETGVPEVLVHIFENQGRSTGKLTEVLFHKMIRGTVAFSDPSARHRLESAKAEISELIF